MSKKDMERKKKANAGKMEKLEAAAASGDKFAQKKLQKAKKKK